MTGPHAHTTPPRRVRLGRAWTILVALVSLAAPISGAAGDNIPMVGFIYPASPAEAVDLAARELARLALGRDHAARTVVAIADGPDNTAEMARRLATLGAGAIVLARRRADLDMVLLPGPGTTLAWEGAEPVASATRLSARLGPVVRLAGALGALTSRSGHIAMVATPEDDGWATAFRAGIHLVNPDAELTIEAPDDEAVVTAARLAERAIDVVLTADTRPAMVDALGDRGLGVILLGGAPMTEPPSGVIASITVDWLAFYRPLLRALTERRPLPQRLSLGIRDGAVALDGPYLSLPPAAAARFSSLRRQATAGAGDRKTAPSPPSMAR